MYNKEEHKVCPFCPVPGLNVGSAPSAKNPQPPLEVRASQGAPSASPRANSSGQPKTIIRWNKPKNPSRSSQEGDSQETAADPNVDPVVGWLVATSGPAMGRDFRIRWGANTIGRDPRRHIHIPDDPQIHRETHAVIIYDRLNNKYLLKGGDGRDLPYVRRVHETEWTLVPSVATLEPYNIVKIGGSEFVFVPLCGEAFEWEL